MPEVAVSFLRWIVLFPLIGCVLCVAAAQTGRVALARLAGPASVLAAFMVAFTAVAHLWAQPEGAALLDHMYTWIQVQVNLSPTDPLFLTLDAAFRVDRLTSVMILIITGVGFLIHVYSLGYMHDDPDVARFFAYLNLFTASMLILVLGESLPLLFIGWEGVGLCSYLLIGFWYTDPANADAGRKAFVANRIGDAAFLIGTFLLFWATVKLGEPTLSFTKISALAPRLDPGMITAICLLLFVGATGKSAQIPLYVWLPDAMAGPTPVSALIHAATMVTAGVYMVTRLSALYVLSPFTLDVIGTIGAATALFAATIGLVQTDLKKILAYSTVSQLGYMFLALGAGAFSAAIFHLMTHAFFKACLFLCAGSVMHAMQGELNIFKMGGLRKHMPITATTFLIAAMSISGVPGFDAFFSKDMILEGAFVSGHTITWFTGLVAAGLTSFYVFRAYFLTFTGESRVDHDKAHHLHESPPTMTYPLIVLAVLSIVGGWVGMPEGFLWGDRFGHYLSPVLAVLPHAEAHERSTGTLLFLIFSATTVAMTGIAVAYAFYGTSSGVAASLAQRAAALYRLLLNKYWIDEIYAAAIVRPYVRLSRFYAEVIDPVIFDGAVNGLGELVRWCGSRLRRLQTGDVQAYALAMLIGAVGVIIALAIR